MEKELNQKCTYVYYIPVKNVSKSRAQQIIIQCMEAFRIKDENINQVFIPTKNYDDVKIECINPVYISEENLIKEHKEKIEKLNKEIEIFLKNN